MTPLWKYETHEQGGVLCFAQRPSQVSRDASEVRTADLPTSVCSIPTVWATHEYDPSMERSYFPFYSTIPTSDPSEGNTVLGQNINGSEEGAFPHQKCKCAYRPHLFCLHSGLG